LTILNRGSMKGLIKMLKQQYTSIVYKWYQLLRAKGYGRCTSFASACSNAMHTFHPDSFEGTLPTIWNGSDEYWRMRIAMHLKRGF